jgi:hypothetical protein
MVAAYLLGGKKPAPRTRSLDQNATFAELAQTVQAAGGSVNLKLPRIYAKVKS